MDQSVTYEYDLLNRMTAATDALGFLSLMTYDANSNLAGWTDQLGKTTTYRSPTPAATRRVSHEVASIATLVSRAIPALALTQRVLAAVRLDRTPFTWSA